MALGSTHPLTEMSTSFISWGSKGGRCIGLTLLPSCADCFTILAPHPPGALRACPDITLTITFTFTRTFTFKNLQPNLNISWLTAAQIH